MLLRRDHIFFIDDTPENKISFYHLLFFIVMLPFDRFYSEIILISFALHIVIHLTKDRIKAALNPQTVILSSVFLINLLGLIYSPDRKATLNDLERQLAILLFPILISASGLNLRKYKDKLLKVFSLTCTGVIAYLFIYNFRLILYNHLPFSYLFSNLFINHNFSAPIEMHATYLSMYVSLALISFLFFLLTSKSDRNKMFYGACMLILLAGLMQLASRNVFIATILIIVVLYPFFIKEKAVRIRFVLIALPVILIALVSIFRTSWLRQRYTTELKNDLTQASINTMEPRVERWQVAWKLFQNAPLLGYGSGTEKRILMDQYFEAKLYNSYLNKLNAHNEYLSIMLKTGVWGLAIFLFTLLYGYISAWRNQNIIFAGFMTLIAFVSFSENIFDVNKTIFFYSFFFSFFVFSSKYKPAINTVFKRKTKASTAKTDSI